LDLNVLEQLFDERNLNATDRSKFENTLKLWDAWRHVAKSMRAKEHTEDDLKQLSSVLRRFGALYMLLYTAQRVFPYMHFLCSSCHLVEQIRAVEKMGHTFSDVSNQSFEHRHKIVRSWFFASTNKDGTTGARNRNGGQTTADSRLQIMCKAYRILMHLWPEVSEHATFETTLLFDATEFIEKKIKLSKRAANLLAVVGDELEVIEEEEEEEEEALEEEAVEKGASEFEAAVTADLRRSTRRHAQ
jgi:hypothetical protein